LSKAKSPSMCPYLGAIGALPSSIHDRQRTSDKLPFQESTANCLTGRDLERGSSAMTESFYKTIPEVGDPPASWKEIEKKCRKALGEEDKWIFRGQRDATWALSTALERALEELAISQSEAWEVEGDLLRRFQRQAHHFIDHLPKDDNFPEWFSLMQHFGAPTRLLDWTHSFYIGLYFAIRDLGHADDGEAALWAIDWQWLESKVPKAHKAIFQEDANLEQPDNFMKLLGSESKPGILKINAFRKNPRLVIQQGAFLVPTAITKSFEENLRSACESAGGNVKGHVLKLRLSHSGRDDALKHLLRMNVNEASLFPDLSGFAVSLKHWLVFGDILPHKLWSKGGSSGRKSHVASRK
jgi:hypothetical protein